MKKQFSINIQQDVLDDLRLRLSSTRWTKFNVQRWTEMAHGGHFAALEAPELLADDIFRFAKALNL